MNDIIREYLKEHLRVEIVQTATDDYHKYDLTVKLILEDEVISEDYGDFE